MNPTGWNRLINDNHRRTENSEGVGKRGKSMPGRKRKEEMKRRPAGTEPYQKPSSQMPPASHKYGIFQVEEGRAWARPKTGVRNLKLSNGKTGKEKSKSSR